MAARPSLKTSVINRETLANAEQYITATFSLVTQDDSGQPLTTGGETVTANVTAEGFAMTLVATDNHNGTYSFTFTPVKSGEHFIEVKLGGQPLAPFAVPVAPPTVSAASTAEGAGTTYTPRGSSVEFTVIPRNRAGAVLPNVDCKIASKIYGASAASKKVELTRTPEGMYKGTYLSVSGMRFLSVSVDNERIVGAPYKLYTGVGVWAYCYNCTASGPGVTGGARGGNKSITMYERDISNILITTQCDSWRVTVKNPNTTTLCTRTTDDDSIECWGDGSYTCSYCPTFAGMHTVIIQVDGGGWGDIRLSPFQIIWT